MKMNDQPRVKVRVCVEWIAMVLLCLYFANFFSNMISPQRQLFLDTDSLNQSSSVMAFVYKENPQTLTADGENNYVGEIDVNGKSYHLNVTTSGAEIQSCFVNGKAQKLIPIKRYTISQYYYNTFCVDLPITDSHKMLWAGALFFAFSWLLCKIRQEVRKSEDGLAVLTYSGTAVKAIGRKPIIVSFVVALVSAGIFYGCDLQVISESIVMWQKGIDIYQLDACINSYKNMELYMWQYEGAMLAGYGLPSYLSYPFLTFFRPDHYHWIQSIEYKLINMLLINGTVLSVLSFLLDKGLIRNRQAKLVYYFSVFNPMIFWIAIIFIQFDMLPIYLVTLGILLISKARQEPITAAFFLGYGISCKVTELMFFPSICLLLVSLFFAYKGCRKEILGLMTCFIIIVTVLMLLPRTLETPIKLAFHALPQANRIWYTFFPYITNAVYLYVAIAGLIFAFMHSALTWNVRGSLEEHLIKTLLMLGIITFVFSSLTISTPSFYLTALPSFVILSSRCENAYELFLKNIFSVLIVVCFLFGPVGDVTATLQFFGKQPIFSPVFRLAEEAGISVQWNSLLFTISVASMWVYIKVFSSTLSRTRIVDNVVEM